MTRKIKAVNILPVQEISFTNAEIKKGLEAVLDRSEAIGVSSLQTKKTLEKIENFGTFPGMQFLAPFFFNKRETFFDYLLQDTLVVLDEADLLEETSHQFEDLIHREYSNCLDKDIVVAKPKELYLSCEELDQKLMAFRGPVVINSLKLTAENNFKCNLRVKQTPQMVGNPDLFSDQIARWKKERQKVVIVTPTKGQVERIHELMNELDFEVDVDCGKLSEGFQFNSENLVFISDHEIFGKAYKRRRKRSRRSMQATSPGETLTRACQQ